ncbi:MAG: hypothetical protein C5B46_04800 [Proteobacteria bacterium]|nr:MAG: hypothetical protein C5B46_04800 [Pseudomonadota bacterium]
MTLVIATMFVSTALSAGDSAAPTPALLVFASGPTSVIGQSGQSTLLSKGGQVRAGDMVRTGPATRAQLRFRDGTYLSLLPGTDLRLDAYRFGSVPKSSELAVFTLYRGGARFQTGSIGKAPGSTFRVATAVAALEGAPCEFVAIAGEGLQLRVGAGHVTVRNNAGTLTAAAGQRAMVANANSPPYLVGTVIPERISP